MTPSFYLVTDQDELPLTVIDVSVSAPGGEHALLVAFEFEKLLCRRDCVGRAIVMRDAKGEQRYAAVLPEVWVGSGSIAVPTMVVWADSDEDKLGFQILEDSDA